MSDFNYESEELAEIKKLNAEVVSLRNLSSWITISVCANQNVA